MSKTSIGLPEETKEQINDKVKCIFADMVELKNTYNHYSKTIDRLLGKYQDLTLDREPDLGKE